MWQVATLLLGIGVVCFAIGILKLSETKWDARHISAYKQPAKPKHLPHRYSCPAGLKYEFDRDVEFHRAVDAKEVKLGKKKQFSWFMIVLGMALLIAEISGTIFAVMHR